MIRKAYAIGSNWDLEVRKPKGVVEVGDLNSPTGFLRARDGPSKPARKNARLLNGDRRFQC
jgi:hypothetical protein